MNISEKKMQIVIDNYFRSECDVNTSIREAFERGFRIGVRKGLAVSKPQTECDTCRFGKDKRKYAHFCNECGVGINNYTPYSVTTDTSCEVLDGWQTREEPKTTV